MDRFKKVLGKMTSNLNLGDNDPHCGKLAGILLVSVVAAPLVVAVVGLLILLACCYASVKAEEISVEE